MSMRKTIAEEEAEMEMLHALQKRRDMFDDVFRFHIPVDMNYRDGMREDEALIDLRRKLCEEEAAEIAEGFGFEAPPWKPRPAEADLVLAHSPEVVDHVKVADGLCDEIFVCIGGLLALYPEACARELWAEVCRANMDKYPGGVAIRREDGKVLKPEGWRPPDIAGILRKYGVIP